MVEIAAKTPTRVIICTRVAERSGLFGEIVFVIKSIPFSVRKTGIHVVWEGLLTFQSDEYRHKKSLLKNQKANVRKYTVSSYRTLPLVWGSDPICQKWLADSWLLCPLPPVRNYTSPWNRLSCFIFCEKMESDVFVSFSFQPHYIRANRRSQAVLHK